MKSIVTVILLVFVAASVVYMAFGHPGEVKVNPMSAKVTQTSEFETEESQEHTEGPRTVVAYYFHRTQRCQTCLTMESYAEGALQEGLPGAVESGELEWRPVNVEEPQHEHFVKEYDVYASALVMVEMEGSEVKRSKNLEQIWDLVGDESKFKAYVRDEALAYLEDTP